MIDNNQYTDLLHSLIQHKERRGPGVQEDGAELRL